MSKEESYFKALLTHRRSLKDTLKHTESICQSEFLFVGAIRALVVLLHNYVPREGLDELQVCILLVFLEDLLELIGTVFFEIKHH